MNKNWKMIADYENEDPIFIADADTENHPQGYVHICNVNPNLGVESFENAILIASAPALRAENAKLREALKPCVALLDGLVKESKRSIDWGEEDSFRMGEWFEKEDIAAIEAARRALESSNE